MAKEAAISVFKNDTVYALSKIEASLHEIPSMLDKGLGIALREKLLYLKDSIKINQF